MTRLAHQIEHWPIDRLVPYARNPRTHSPRQVAQIAASISEFGFNSPILVASDAGIIAGHGRLLAARQLGLSEVPVIVLDHLDENARRAFLIADNRLTDLGGWDNDLLALELKELSDASFDTALTGFEESDVAGLLALLETGAEAPEPAAEQIAEEPATPVTGQGDLWLVGPHRILCGDCRDAAVVAGLMGGQKAAVVVTSPPYATQRQYDPTSGFQPIPPDEYVAWYRAVAHAVESVLAPDGSYFLLCGAPHNRNYAETMIMRSRRRSSSR